MTGPRRRRERSAADAAGLRRELTWPPAPAYAVVLFDFDEAATNLQEEPTQA